MEEAEQERLSRVEALTLRMSVIQTFIAVTGFFVAIVALYAALNESDAVRKQQQASVWPNLEFQTSFREIPGSERLEVLLRNSGIGPAKVESISVYLDGDPLTDWDQLITSFTDIEDPLFSYDWVSRRVLRPDDEIALLSIRSDELNSRSVIEIREAVGNSRLRVELCYCSFFRDCWNLSSEARDPLEVDQCALPSMENGF